MIEKVAVDKLTWWVKGCMLSESDKKEGCTNQSNKTSVSEQSSVNILVERTQTLEFESTFRIICESFNSTESLGAVS